mgnify:CR=1 FL=1
MLNAGVLTFHEYAMREPLPLATIHEALLDFLRGRKDAVLFGATAVNAYVSEPRMTQDVDLLSVRAAEFAEELREHLSEKFRIAVRVPEIKDKGFRLYQVRKEGNRHVADVRMVAEFAETRTVENILVLSPAELIASKVISFQSRFGKSKSWTDRRDLTVLLLQFPELKSETGEVAEILRRNEAGEKVFDAWREIVAQDLQVEDEDEDLIF